MEVIKLDVLDEYERNYALSRDIDVLVNNGAVERAGPFARSRSRASVRVSTSTSSRMSS